MKHYLPFLGTKCVTSVRCVTLACTLICSPMLFAEDVEVEADPPLLKTDYSVCNTCDVGAAEDPEVKHLAELIAETRWSLTGADEGIMVIKNDKGESADWRWTSIEGVLETLERKDHEQEE